MLGQIGKAPWAAAAILGTAALVPAARLVMPATAAPRAPLPIAPPRIVATARPTPVAIAPPTPSAVPPPAAQPLILAGAVLMRKRPPLAERPVSSPRW
jgi:hypothetical protein